MASVSSNMIDLGTQAPDFELPDTLSNRVISLQDFRGDNATVIMFICNHCPYVKHIIDKVVEVANEFLEKDVSFIAISSNDVAQYPDDAPEKMTEFANDHDFPFPYVYDETQEVAKAYEAACTPDIYVFDGDLKLVYRGQFDDSRPKNDEPVTGRDLRNALNNIALGLPIPKDQKPSIGCNIKWKSA